MVKFFKTSLLYGLLIVLSSALPQWAAAQSRVVSGTVKDEKGTGLPGVTIIVKGTAGGTTSMADGQYSVKVSAGDELEFSFIGYASQTVRIGAQSVVDITLQEQSLLAEEVVVTAYAVQKKVNVTGSISQVKGTDLVATPVANISNALIGNTPGVSRLTIAFCEPSWLPVFTARGFCSEPAVPANPFTRRPSIIPGEMKGLPS